VEATSLVCVGGVAVLYSGRWFALGSRKARCRAAYGSARSRGPKTHLRYLACGHTRCNHSATVFVLTTAITWCGPTAATRAALQQGQPLQAQIAFQQKRCAYGLPAVAASAGREMVPSVQDPIAYGLVGDRVGEMNANEYHECRFGPERAHSFCVQEHDRQSAMAARNQLESSLGDSELCASSIKVNLTAHMNLMNTRGDCARTHRRHLRRAR
jgi:hypothetical protein